jgi:hypothetical protein
MVEEWEKERCRSGGCRQRYVASFWPVEGLTELADGPTRCGEVASSGCLFA